MEMNAWRMTKNRQRQKKGETKNEENEDKGIKKEKGDLKRKRIEKAWKMRKKRRKKNSRLKKNRPKGAERNISFSIGEKRLYVRRVHVYTILAARRTYMSCTFIA